MKTTALSNKQIFAFIAMVVGMFMAILDIQIVASSLPVIAAGLNASTDELAWVQTAYLIAEVMIIPITGFTARCFSTRISFFVASSGFTIMSILCSLAWNIESMILFRALQGFFGGAMIPTIFGIIFIIFPPEKRPMVTVFVGLVVTIAPTTGPTIGGYITELLSWHFMFLLNVIPGIFVSIVVFLYADFDKPNYNLLKNFDYIGIILMILWLGTTQYILEEGGHKGWFEDSSILFLTIFCLISFILLIVRELSYINPILDFSSFLNRNFTFGCVYSFVIGVGLYGAVYLLPIFLFRVANFNTIQIGSTMVITGLSQFLSGPIAGKLSTTGIDLRIILAFGLFLFGSGCYANSFLTADSQFWEFLLPQMMRGFALMFCFIPVNTIALGTMSKEQVQNASGLYNLTRNLGGAFGLAVISSTIRSNTIIFTQYINESTDHTITFSRIAIFADYFEGKVADPEKAAYFLLSNIVQKEAFIMAVNNSFVIISIFFFVSMILLPLTSKIGNNKAHENSAH